jgi:hypothetical protein
LLLEERSHDSSEISAMKNAIAEQMDARFRLFVRNFIIFFWLFDKQHLKIYN